MDGRHLILNPGPNQIELPGSEAGYADGVLWLYLADVTLPEAFALLTVPEHTATIAYQYGEMEDRYEGYNSLTAIFADGDMTRAALRRDS